MPESSPTLDRTTTKSRSVLFGSLRSKGHGNVAEVLGISESTFSEWINKHGDRIAQLLTALDLKPVPVNAKCYLPEHLEHLNYFAAIGMKHADSADQLFNDPE